MRPVDHGKLLYGHGQLMWVWRCIHALNFDDKADVPLEVMRVLGPGLLLLQGLLLSIVISIILFYI